MYIYDFIEIELYVYVFNLMYVYVFDLMYLYFIGLMCVFDLILIVMKVFFLGLLFVLVNELEEFCVWGGYIFIKLCVLIILGFKIF